MLLSAILSYLPYSLATAFTPGPNNILALYSVSQKGWRRGKSILCGIGFGFLSVMILCALFCYELVTYLPSVTGILKYAGAAYIVFLAVHIALSRPDDAEYTKISFSKGFFLQFVNAKIILYAITVYTGYLSPHGQTLRSLLIHACVMTATGMAGILTWAAAGNIFQKFQTKYYRPFHILMSLILLWCAFSLLLGR